MADGKVYSVEESLRSLEKDIKDLTKEMTEKARRSVELLAGTAYDMIAREAQEKLKSTRKLYTDNLNIKKISSSGDNTIHAVVLYKPARWIEEGMPAHNMIDDLTSGPKSRAYKKGGGRWNIIPFEHTKPSQQRSEQQTRISDHINKELKAMGLNKVIKGRDGKPIMGRAVSLSLLHHPPGVTRKDVWRTPLLSGLTIYQSAKTGKDGEILRTKKGAMKVKKDIFTFRVVSTRQRDSGLWDHPGLEGLKAFETVEKKLDSIWQQMINELVK